MTVDPNAIEAMTYGALLAHVVVRSIRIHRVGSRRPGDVVESYANVDKARQQLEWQAELVRGLPELSITDAMRDAYRWQLSLRDNPLEKRSRAARLVEEPPARLGVSPFTTLLSAHLLGPGFTSQHRRSAWRLSAAEDSVAHTGVVGLTRTMGQTEGTNAGAAFRRTLRSIACHLARHHPKLAEREFAWEAFWEVLFDWPPDVFAFTSMALEASGAYVRAVSPPDPAAFPPKHWGLAVQMVGKGWLDAIIDGQPPLATSGSGGDLLRKWAKQVEDSGDLDIAGLGEESTWPVVRALLALHAIADEACQGVGVPGGGARLPNAVKRLGGDAAPGTLSHFPPELIRVLPNFRTPQRGLTLRSLSFHLCAVQSEVGVRWQTIETSVVRDESLNILVIPVPESVQATDFRPVAPPHRIDDSMFGFFRFAPPDDSGVPDRIVRIVQEALAQHRRVDIVVLPEQSITRAQLTRVESELRKLERPPLLLAGVREDNRNFARLCEPGQRFFDQDKHHRWYLDAGQIQQYGLGSVLPVNRKWWECMQLGRRELNFVAVNNWLLLCPLICEDLARQEPVANIVRAVGPNLIMALLLDGPQLGHRWASRYATVLADDPGSSVLCVTSLGMALRSVPRAGGTVRRVIGLWKDAITGMHELELDPGANAMLIATAVSWTKEWTADGRGDDECAANLVWGGSWQVTAPPERAIDKSAEGS